MWPLELAVTATLSEASYLQITIVAAFFYWLLQARVRAMVDVMSTKLYEACSTPYDGVKQSSASLHHQLTQFQLRKREQLIKNKTNASITLENAVYDLKESPWSQPATQEKRPLVGLSCESCTPTSRKNSQTSFTFPIIDVTQIQTIVKRPHGFIAGTFSTIAHCMTFTKYKYPRIRDSVLQDENVQNIIKQEVDEMASELGITDEKGLQLLLKKQKQRAFDIINLMHSKLSDFVIRVSAWVFLKTLPLFFKSISIPESQIEMLKKASASGVPLIFIPLHRSHIDYIAVTLTLCTNGIRSPLVASGENLNIPIFGRILHGLGAFYIKRRIDPVAGKKDKVYRSILHTYMTQSLQAGHYFEFFIEGGRTRSGKPCLPKGGLLSVFVDAYLSGVLEDALLVPVSVNYEKIVEGSFVRELSGEAKKPESFFTAVSGIWKALTSQYGLVRVDFNQPFSLHELIRSFQGGRLKNDGGDLHVVPSSASLYGTDVVDEDQRSLVENIARHVVYDCAQSTAVMSTNALAFLLLNVHRSGVSLSDLVYSLDRLRDELKISGKDVGFSGESKDVLIHAIELLGPGLVRTDCDSTGVIVNISPITILPNVIELSYYSNSILPHFCLEGVISICLKVLCRGLSVPQCRLTLDRIVDLATVLCEILQFEFIFTKPCQSLSTALYNCIDGFTTKEIIQRVDFPQVSTRSARNLDIVDEDEDREPSAPMYMVNVENIELEIYSNTLKPIIDTYYRTINYCSLPMNCGVVENVLVKNILQHLREIINDGVLPCAESLSSDTVRNCLRLLEKLSALSVAHVGGVKTYSSVEDMENVVQKIAQFRI